MISRLFQIVLASAFMAPHLGYSWTIMDESRSLQSELDGLAEKLDGYFIRSSPDSFSYQDYTKLHDKYMESLGKQLKLNGGHTYKLPEEVIRQKTLTGTGHVKAYTTLSFKSAPMTEKELCENGQKKFSINQLLANQDNRMGFVNEGGLFGKGTCWWHSSLTRAAAYLAYYDPTAAKPSQKEAKAIIEKLSQMDQVVRIPGYRNWNHFSAVHQLLIQDKLDSWQKSEALNFGWVRGVQGSARDNASDMKEQMDALYNEIRLHGRPVYQMLQMAGYYAHAWIVLDVEKTAQGYYLYVTDSNHESVDKWSYTYGAPHFYYITTSVVPFIPYTNSKEKGQQAMLQNALRNFCKRNSGK